MLYLCPRVFVHLTTDGTQIISGWEIFQTASQWLWVYRRLLISFGFMLRCVVAGSSESCTGDFGGTFHEVFYNDCSSQCTSPATTDRGPIFSIPSLMFLTPCLSGKDFPKKWRN